jgi:diguanylate cyclase
MRRMFAIYAVISLVPVLALGFLLVTSIRNEAQRRGMSEGRSEATLIARTAVEPLLDGRPLSLGISPSEHQALSRLTVAAIGDGDILRLRLRDLSGRVKFSDDGSGFRSRPEDEAIEAARGETVAHLTRVNSDSNDTGRVGEQSVEVYLPQRAGTPRRRVGVLEIYLPYAPISQDVTSGLQMLYRDIALGLTLVYLALFAITISVSRGLRRQVKLTAFLAERDPLTGLPNRVLFHRRAGQALGDAIKRKRPVTIAIVDLDHFKEINDTLGHHYGDELLAKVAGVLSASMRPGDTVARLGGDEFGLIVHDTTKPEQALARLRDAIGAEVEIRGLPLSVQASVGMAVAPEDGADIETLLQHADIAMYVAKAQHLGVVRYEPELDQYDPAKLSLIAELRHAIDDGQLVLHYQPQVAMNTGRVDSVEALVRWQHPTHGLLYPDSFLPLAEQTDLIDHLTRWVLQAALRELRTLDGASGCELQMSVNVSARSVSRADFAASVIDILKLTGVAPERLTIEVTETALLSDPTRAATVLGELSAAGVSISLDDFGQGQTSLGYLSTLPIDELKIDKGFVIDMLENPAHAAIARSIIDLGRNLQLRVVGEGVENDEILDTLRAAGCDVAQGFLIARPIASDALTTWLQERSQAEQAFVPS